jgi:hypothetical protein
MPYKIHCYKFLYLRTLRNTACARLLLCYIPSRNITISELTISIKPKITNQKLLKRSAYQFCSLQMGPTDINIAQILHLSNFLN